MEKMDSGEWMGQRVEQYVHVSTYPIPSSCEEEGESILSNRGRMMEREGFI